jgi:hypothetical protein
MINRSFVAVAASVALLSTSAILAGKSAEAARPRKPTIGNATLSPKRLPGSGGTVNIRVSIKPNAATVGSVTASSTMTGGSPSTSSSLLSTGNNIYTGSVRIDRNSRTRPTSANVFVEVNSSSGIVRKKVGTIRVDPGGGNDDNAPPPPPDI